MTADAAHRALLVAAHEVLSEVDIQFMLDHPSEELCERVRRNRLIALVAAIDASSAELTRWPCRLREGVAAERLGELVGMSGANTVAPRIGFL